MKIVRKKRKLIFIKFATVQFSSTLGEQKKKQKRIFFFLNALTIGVRQYIYCSLRFSMHAPWLTLDISMFVGWLTQQQLQFLMWEILIGCVQNSIKCR